MSITIEKIEELRKRTSLGYEDAKKVLEKHKGDVVEALIELEKSKQLNNGGQYTYTYTNNNGNGNCCKHTSEHAAKLKTLCIKGNQSKFIVTKKGETIVKVPVNYLIVSIILGFHLALLSLILILVTGCKMSIQKCGGTIMDVDDVIIDMAEKVKNNAENYINNKHSSVNNSSNGNTGNNINTGNNNNNSNNSSNTRDNDNTQNNQAKNAKSGGITLEKDYNEFTVE